MPRTWLRLYCEMPLMPKARKLPDRLFRALIQCWTLYKLTGDLTAAEYQLNYGGEHDEVESIMTELQARNWLTPIGDGHYKPNDWDDHQYVHATSTERVRQWRSKKAQESAALSQPAAQFTRRVRELVAIDEASARLLWSTCAEKDPGLRVQDLIVWIAEKLARSRPQSPVGFLLRVAPAEVDKMRARREAIERAEREAAERREQMMSEDL